MVVLIPHPTQELLFTRLQKDLISTLNDDFSIWYRNIPLWIELEGVNLTTKKDLKDFSKTIEDVEVGDIQISPTNDQFFLPINVKTKNGNINTTLPLVRRLENWSGECGILKEKTSQIPKFLTIFRLGIVTSPKNSHNAGTAVKGSQACTYVLQDSVWFKKSK